MVVVIVVVIVAVMIGEQSVTAELHQRHHLTSPLRSQDNLCPYASVTWKYCFPRKITRIHVSPVIQDRLLVLMSFLKVGLF